MNERVQVSTNVIPFPGHKQTYVEKLREKLSALVLARDELIHQECKNIEMAYMLSVGGLEYRFYETECAVLRLKRKADLIQAKKNRQEKVDLNAIEDLLDREFADYKKKLDAEIERMNDALYRKKGVLLTEEETREIRDLYRAIIRALHPDLHPDLAESGRRLFQNAVEAYKAGDLEDLRIIYAMLPHGLSGGKITSDEIERLKKSIAKVERLINEIKSEFPYTARELVRDPQKIQEKKIRLQNSIKQLEDVFKIYQDRIEKMLG